MAKYVAYPENSVKALRALFISWTRPQRDAILVETLLHPKHHEAKPCYAPSMPNDRSIERVSLSPEQSKERQKVMGELRNAGAALRFMTTYAQLIDEYGGDVIAGLLPAVGDAGSSIISMLTGMVQASRAGLPITDRLMMLISQATDLGIGTIPVVGDLADYLYKSNVGAKNRFLRHFQTKLIDAWKRGLLAATDIAELEKISGVTIRLPADKGVKAQRREAA